MTSYPSGAYPSLINDKVGERRVIGDMVKAQQPQALGAINGDFFIFPDIRYVSDIEMARGPMVRDGRVIRGTEKRQRVVGIDTNKQPFGGMMAVRGTVTPVARHRLTGVDRVDELAQHPRRRCEHLHHRLEQRAPC